MLSTREKRVGLKSIAKSLTAGLWMFMASKVVSAAETDAIGRVDTVEGTVHVLRDGEKILLSKDDPIFQGDTILTGADGSIGITFIDQTVFSLGEDGEMTIDEMVYDKDAQEGKFAANMVKGVFSFISGEIAKTDPEGMSLNTPVGVIGIRGTKIAGVAAAEGNENTISLLPEMGRDGKPIVGELVMTNSSGSVVLNQVGATVQLTSSFQAPPPPVVLDKQQIQQSYGKTLTTLSSTVVVKATNDAAAAEKEVAQKETAAEEAIEAAEEAKQIAEETGDKEAIAEAEKLAEVAQEAVAEVEVAKEVVEDIKEVVEIAKQEFEVQKEAFKEFVVDEKPAEEKPQDQEKPVDAEEGADDQPNEGEGGEPEGDAPQDVAPEGPIEGEGEELLEEGEPELLEGEGEEPEILEGEGEKPPEEVLLEEAPPEDAKPQEQEVVEEKPPEPEQVVEVAPEVIEQQKPVMEAPKPIEIAPVVPDIVFVAPAPEPIMVVHDVVEHYVEPVVEIVYNEPEIIERPKFMAMARPAYIEVVEEVVEEEVEEETVEPQPNLLGVGSTGATINAALSIGYYSMSNGQGLSKQVAPIEEGGHTAVKMTTLSETELASVDILWAINPSNSSHGSEFTNAVDRIKERVDEGMILVIHDRQVGNAENILFGEEPADIVRKFTNSRAIDVVDENTVVGEGPGGLLTDSSIDGGNSSNHGYTKRETLPEDSLALLTTSDEDEVVDFAYKYGEGAVIYSSIPLDFYLGGYKPNFKDIYAPNILQFAASLVTDGYSTIQGTNNNDIVSGTANNDTLEGLDGNDTIYGFYGDDTLYGGSGADTLNGGSGSDIYIYRSQSDSPVGSGDIIKGYEENEQFDISAFTSTFNIVPSFTGGSTPEVTYNSNTKLLQLDLDSDTAADMEVTLENYSGSFEEGTYENGILT